MSDTITSVGLFVVRIPLSFTVILILRIILYLLANFQEKFTFSLVY